MPSAATQNQATGSPTPTETQPPSPSLSHTQGNKITILSHPALSQKHSSSPSAHSLSTTSSSKLLTLTIKGLKSLRVVFSPLILSPTLPSQLLTQQSPLITLKILLTLESSENKIKLFCFQLTTKTSSSVTTILRSEPKSTVTTSTVLEKDSNKVSARKTENGLFSTEIEDSALIGVKDYKHMATIPFIL